jgi:heavy metal-(Cd/Co/Hg/Pb/Zn)-translocating P-type ATPase
MSTTLDAPPRIGALARGERIALATRLTLACLAAGLLVLSLLWRWAFPSDAPLSELVAGAAALIVGVPVFAAGWQSLRAPSLHGITDRLIALALVGAWATGDLTTAALLPIVMIVGHVLEERSLIGSRDAIAALERLADTDSRRLHPDGHVELVPTSALRPGDLIELRAGDRLPVDGIVREGEASLDLASLTGESVPIDAAAGDPIASGAIDLDGRLVVEVTRVGRESTIGKIIALMQDAERAKPPVTRMLERHAGSYMAFVLTVTAATWFATGNGNATLAVLVASCPCALVLAAPATAIAAIAVAARHGILIKGTAFLENLADVTSIVFDKTGTLTTGALTLVAIEATPGVDGDTVLTLAASLAAGSSHPVSRAAREIAFGRPDLFSRLGIEAPQPPPHQGPIAGVSEAGVFAGWLLFADQVRPEAAAALADLRGLGLTRQMLLTGDRDIVAQRVAASLGITETESEALPERKMARVLAEIDAGWHPLVVGDGINDSLALRAGAVGVAMGAQGTDVALASADLVLLSSDLARLPTMIRLSRRCRRTIATNVGLGLGWTLVLMALAASGSLGAQGAVVAALLHNLSTFAGLANAGRLLLFDETQGSIKSAESSRIPSRNIDHPVTRA